MNSTRSAALRILISFVLLATASAGAIGPFAYLQNRSMPLSIGPALAYITFGSEYSFDVSGGVEPYSFSVVSGLGSFIDSTESTYSAPAAGTSGSSGTVQVRDSVNRTATANFILYNKLTLSPLDVTLPTGATQTFTATGGYGTRAFRLVSGGGSINSSTGVYTAPGVPTEAVIEVYDNIGNAIEAFINVVNSLTISPKTARIPVYSSRQFTSILGTGTVTYSVLSGIGSVVSSTGVYTAPSTTGTAVVRARDANNITSDAEVTIIKPVQMALGTSFTCALFNEGSVKCWGTNGSGQLGLGDIDSRGDAANEMGPGILPYVDFGGVADQIAAGASHVCVRLTNGSVKCWGANANGQLGLNDTTNRGTSPSQMGTNLPTVNLGAGRTAKSIHAGYAQTCAILDDDTLKCWGLGTYGALGQGNTSNVGHAANSMENLQPVNVGTGRTVKSVAIASGSMCAILDDDTLKCWGRNDFGQLGIGNTSTIGDVASEMGDALAVTNLGPSLYPVAIRGGQLFFCALLNTAQAKCWGYGISGSLGNGSTVSIGDALSETGSGMPFVRPSEVGTPLSNITAISVGRRFGCAFLSNNTVRCWGHNTSGQVGIGSTTTSFSTAQAAINFGTGVTPATVALGYTHGCVLASIDRMKCWGSGAGGGLATGATANQTRPPIAATTGGLLADGWVNP
jgi:alpha-tubulin suppressor-like RCC1 family protein